MNKIREVVYPIEVPESMGIAHVIPPGTKIIVKRCVARAVDIIVVGKEYRIGADVLMFATKEIR